MSTFTMEYDLDEEYLTNIQQLIHINSINNQWQLQNTNGESPYSANGNNAIFNYVLEPTNNYLDQNNGINTTGNNNIVDIKIKKEPRNNAVYKIILDKVSCNHHSNGYSCSDEDDICVICQENLGSDGTKWVTIGCNHKYHVSCITNWLYEQWNRFETPITNPVEFNKIYECPLCRAKF